VSLSSIVRNQPSLSEEDLVEMFSSIPQDTRQRIMSDLSLAIIQTKEDAATSENPEIHASYEKLLIIQEAVTKAEREFSSLNVKHHAV
jgi:hypothetical protein